MPVTIIGAHESWPPGRRLPRPGRLTIVYHPVIAPPEGADVKGAARALAHRVHAVVASALPAHQRPDAARDAPGWRAQRWSRSVQVPVTTLDALIDRLCQPFA